MVFEFLSFFFAAVVVVDTGESALHYAAFGGHESVVTVLLEFNAQTALKNRCALKFKFQVFFIAPLFFSN